MYLILYPKSSVIFGTHCVCSKCQPLTDQRIISAKIEKNDSDEVDELRKNIESEKENDSDEYSDESEHDENRRPITGVL